MKPTRQTTRKADRLTNREADAAVTAERTPRLRQSLVFRVGALMVSIGILAMGSMLASFFIADAASHDAAIINEAGALRMQTRQALRQAEIAASANNEALRQSAMNELLAFDRRIVSPVLQGSQRTENTQLFTHFQHVATTWRMRIRPLLIAVIEGHSVNHMPAISVFYNDLERLVELYQFEAEKRIRMLRLIQIISLFSTITLIFFALRYMNQRIEKPLAQLIQVARQVGQGRFDVRASIDQENELGLLGETINGMNAQLAESYEKLQDRIAQKTQELHRNNEMLAFLYNVSRQINENHHRNLDFDNWLKQLAKLTGAESLDLCLMTPEGETPFEEIHTSTERRPECISQECHKCIGDGIFVFRGPGTVEYKYPLTRDESNYGILTCNMQNEAMLDDWIHQILRSFADQAALAMSLRNQSDQQRRLVLMNERTVIARELHDSLAQSLSYLKIQTTRLTRAVEDDTIKPEFNSIVDELREGLNSAYRQLRELLTTFRLQISEEGLNRTLQDVVRELQEQRPDIIIKLDFQAEQIPFTPNEEIHMLQIAREALLNAAHHSQGSEIELFIGCHTDERVLLRITDNGIGIPDTPEKLNHYGLAIMQERSRTLGGKLVMTRRSTGGTLITFDFEPEYVKRRLSA